MNENLVLVRAFGDRPVISAVLEREGDVVLVCKPEHAEAIRSGARPMPMLGFRKSEVYACDGNAIQMVQRGEKIDWNRLVPVQ